MSPAVRDPLPTFPIESGGSIEAVFRSRRTFELSGR